MYYKFGEQFEFIHNYVTLYPGDVILTGSPAGVGPIKVRDNLNSVFKQNGSVLVEMQYHVE